MKTLAHCALVMLGAVGLAHARPVFVENVSTITNPNPALWTGFPFGVAVSGDYAIVGAEYWEQVSPTFSRLHQTAFLYRRSGSGWALERQLAETVVDQGAPRHWLTVDMSSTVAVVSTTPLTFYEFGPSGWTLAPSDGVLMSNSSFDVETDGNRVIIGEYQCASNAAIFEKAADGVWRRSITLSGAAAACDPEIYGRAADVSGNWAVVHQPSGAGIPETEQQAWIFRRSPSLGWVRHDAVSRPRVAWLFPGTTQLAMRGTDVFMSGGLDGTLRFSPDSAWDYQLAEQLRPVDGSMGSNEAAQLETSGDLLLQKTLLWDRSYQPAALNVWQRQPDGSHEHVAVLVHRGNAEWYGPSYEGPANNTVISGRTVLATDPYNRVVYHFELPATFGTPSPQQETFNIGGPTNWTTSAGSLYTTQRGDRSRVLRQSQLALDTRAIYQPADWTTAAIEVDVKVAQFADESSAISLITRYQGPQNYYEFVWGPSGMQFRRMASGTLRTLVSYPSPSYGGIQAGQNRRLRLESVGTRHQVFIDGRPHLTIFSTGPTRGRLGLSTYRATADFDNVLITPSPLTTIYRNDFATTEPVAWVKSGVGNWYFEEGYDSDVRLAQSDTTGEGRVTIGTPTSEQSVQATARLMQLAPTTQPQWFGVVARYVDARNHYTLGLSNSNRLTLAKRVNGVRTVLGTFVVELVPERYYLIRLDAVGDQLRAYLDDRLLFERTDATHPTGSVGMATSRAHAEFENFNAYQP